MRLPGLARFLKMIGKFKSVKTVKRKGVTARFDTSDHVAKIWFYPRYLNKIHEPAVTDLILDRLGPSDIFFDIGANLGWYTLLASRRCSRGSVHAFEIDPTLCGLMERSLQRNDEQAGFVTLVCTAVMDRNDYCPQFAPLRTGKAATNAVATSREGLYATRVSATTIDTYVRAADVAPSLIKLDVEGVEDLSIAGAWQTLASHRPDLIIEVHPRQLAARAIDPWSVLDMVNRAVPEYQLYAVSTAGDASRRLEPVNAKFAIKDTSIFLFTTQAVAGS